MSVYPPPVPLVYAPDIIAATRLDSDDTGARWLAQMSPTARAMFYEFSTGKPTP